MFITMRKLIVVAALIKVKNKYLIGLRSTGKYINLWEFPGGKIEADESKEACLIREILEELELNISIGMPLTATQHQYPEFSIPLYPFLCKITAGTIHLTEHAQAKWIEIDELTSYDWADADFPIVKEILEKYAT